MAMIMPPLFGSIVCILNHPNEIVVVVVVLSVSCTKHVSRFWQSRETEKGECKDFANDPWARRKKGDNNLMMIPSVGFLPER